MNNQILESIKQKFLTLLNQTPEISQNREVLPPQSREDHHPVYHPISDSLTCPYCQSNNFIRRGFRQKKREKVQLYLCLNCQKTFTPHHSASHKHFPLSNIFQAISFYNLGYSFEEACRKVKEKSQVLISPASLSRWVAEFEGLCKFSRMRAYATRRYPPQEMVIKATLAHRQLYLFQFHRAKCELVIEDDFRNRSFESLPDFLLNVPAECPHQYFQQGLRASETPLTFSKTQMIVRAKQNYANALATFVLQGVQERKERHQALEDFMLFNDSVTVATEVPVYLTREDLLHMKTQLGFQIYLKEKKVERKEQITDNKEQITEMTNTKIPISKLQFPKNDQEPNSNDQNNPLPKLPDIENASLPTIADLSQLPKLITGHIDILQIRNGLIHILDFKPRAEKEQPIDQLTIYAMALSRLTGLRLFCFKCGWFDEKDYFEFFPLHVLYKPKKGSRRRKVETSEGVYSINRNPNKVEGIRHLISDI